MGVGMAKIAAAYIANGAPRIRGRSARRFHTAQGGHALAWKRIYCLFRLLKAFDNPDDPAQLVLLTDNEPPQVDDLLMGPLIEKLGVEIRVLDFFWRSEAEPERPDFFLFDALENLSATMDMDDTVLLFSSEAHVMQGLAGLYAELDHNRALLVENSMGEISEAALFAYREEVHHIRKALNAPCAADGMMAVNTHLLGLSGTIVSRLKMQINRLMPKNMLRYHRKDAFLSEPGEVLAAAMSRLDFDHPNIKGLSETAAALPDELETSHLSTIPVIIPGYGRAPETSALFDRLITSAPIKQNHADDAKHITSLITTRSTPSLLSRLGHMFQRQKQFGAPTRVSA